MNTEPNLEEMGITGIQLVVNEEESGEKAAESVRDFFTEELAKEEAEPAELKEPEKTANSVPEAAPQKIVFSDETPTLFKPDSNGDNPNKNGSLQGSWKARLVPEVGEGVEPTEIELPTDFVPKAPERREAVHSIGKWIMTILLTSLPTVGIIMLFVWAFADGSRNRQNYCRAMLILRAIGLVIGLVCLTAMLPYLVDIIALFATKAV